MARKGPQKQYTTIVRDCDELRKIVEDGWCIVALAPCPGYHLEGRPVHLVVVYE